MLAARLADQWAPIKMPGQPRTVAPGDDRGVTIGALFSSMRIVASDQLILRLYFGVSELPDTRQKATSKGLKTRQEQSLELTDYQANLQMITDQRIQLDLDDGVAYNDTRFKGLVYEGADCRISTLERKAQ